MKGIGSVIRQKAVAKVTLDSGPSVSVAICPRLEAEVDLEEEATVVVVEAMVSQFD